MRMLSRASLAFQSTRPVRGATMEIEINHGDARVSIHAPRAGRDHFIPAESKDDQTFQSTRPVRGATADGAQQPA